MNDSDVKIEKTTVFAYMESFQNNVSAVGIKSMLSEFYKSLNTVSQIYFFQKWNNHINGMAELFNEYLNKEASGGKITFPRYNWNTIYEKWKTDSTKNDLADESSIGSSTDMILSLDDAQRLKEATIEFLQKNLTDDYKWLEKRYFAMSDAYKRKNKT